MKVVHVRLVPNDVNLLQKREVKVAKEMLDKVAEDPAGLMNMSTKLFNSLAMSLQKWTETEKVKIRWRQ